MMKNLQTLTIDSREVAKMLPKRHDHLIRDISTYRDYLNVPKIGAVDFFQESSYQDSKGEKRKCYLITKKGCEFIAHKMTGKKGALFTATYINRFHEMEEALKHPASSTPAPVMNRYTWHGNIVMTSMQLQQLTGIDRTNLRTRTKREGMRYLLLTGSDLQAFRKENNFAARAGKRIIYQQGTVIVLLKILGLYGKLKDYIEEYFKIGKYAPKAPTKDVSCNTKIIHDAVNEISEKLLTMNGLLKHLTAYKRKPEDHEALIRNTEELGVSVFTGLQQLQTKVRSLEV